MNICKELFPITKWFFILLIGTVWSIVRPEFASDQTYHQNSNLKFYSGPGLEVDHPVWYDERTHLRLNQVFPLYIALGYIALEFLLIVVVGCIIYLRSRMTQRRETPPG
jgi:hypothetical protein